MKLEYLTAVELGKMVNEKEIAPTEVISYFADRIARRNRDINAFTYTKIEEAMSDARALEARMAVGENPGPFAGVPVALKDFLPSRKGWTNSHGGVEVLIREDTEDSAFWMGARAAGAIAVGKTNAPAFAFRGTTDNKLYGPTSTPFKTGYNSGGSSGGTAAAVADGLIPIGEASDGGGSIRIPASWCGCFGFKASFGTIPSISRPDGWPAIRPYCFNGAISRSVLDSAVILNYMAAYDPRDPYSVDLGKRDFTSLMRRSLKGWRIGYTDDFDLFPVDDEVKKLVRKAAEKFKEAGASVEPVHFHFPRSHDAYAKYWCRSICFDTAVAMENWKKQGLDLAKDYAHQLPEEFIYWNRQMLKADILELQDMNVMRTEILDAQEEVFKNHDLILSPVTICPPVRNASDGDTKGPAELNGQKLEPLIGFAETFFENFTGNPAASVPAGLTKSGLPVGMQIIGRKFLDEDVLAASYTYEQINPWSYDIPYGRM